MSNENNADGLTSHDGSSLAIQPKDETKAHRRGRVSVSQFDGVLDPQGHAEITRLQGELDSAIAESRKYSGNVPVQLRTRMDALSKSLNYQMGQQGNVARGAEVAEVNSDETLARSARDTDLQAAVNRAMREHGVSKKDAFDIVNAQIETDGVSRVLPNFARIMARMNAKYNS